MENISKKISIEDAKQVIQIIEDDTTQETLKNILQKIIDLIDKNIYMNLGGPRNDELHDIIFKHKNERLVKIVCRCSYFHLNIYNADNHIDIRKITTLNSTKQNEILVLIKKCFDQIGYD